MTQDGRIVLGAEKYVDRMKKNAQRDRLEDAFEIAARTGRRVTLT